MKKVIIFSLTYHPYIGGAEVAIKEISERIDPKEIEFDIITLRFDSALPKFERVGNVNVYRVGFTLKHPNISNLSAWPLKINKYLFPLFGLLKALRLHRDRQYDVAWNMMANYAAFTILGFKLIHPKVQYLLSLQEGDPIDYLRKRVGIFYPLYRLIFIKADFIQTISTYLGEWARKEGYKGPLEVVPNGVDVKKFSKKTSTSKLNALRQKLDKKPGDIFLITTSRLVKKNAIDDVIRALQLLPRNIKFIILGIGPDEEALRNLARESGVERRVQFVGQVDQDEIPQYLQVSDIFIRTSLSEGFGNSFIEAMAAGLPVIATQEGGIADFLFDPEKDPRIEPTGRAVNVRDAESIAQAVQLYINDKEMTEKIVANAKAMVSLKYDWSLVAQEMREKVFGKLFK